MIIDSETNYLYLADTLPKKYPSFYQRFETLLKRCNVGFDFLPKTKDIWAVDYMPIQIGLDQFVQFTYRPPYLTSTKKWSKIITDPDHISGILRLVTTRSNIILDGGNIVRSKRKAMITERLFLDNPEIDRKKLIAALYELLEVERIFFIPQQPRDFTGHADGMVRFLDDDTILVSDFKDCDVDFHRSFENAIHNTGLDRFTIPYSSYNNQNDLQADGCYINYLQMKDLVIVPTFGIREDDEVYILFDQIFAGNSVYALDSKEIANDGGVLNCITWNILRN